MFLPKRSPLKPRNHTVKSLVPGPSGNTNIVYYRVARDFCGSLCLRIGDFLCFAEINFYDKDRLVFLGEN